MPTSTTGRLTSLPTGSLEAKGPGELQTYNNAEPGSGARVGTAASVETVAGGEMLERVRGEGSGDLDIQQYSVGISRYVWYWTFNTPCLKKLQFRIIPQKREDNTFKFYPQSISMHPDELAKVKVVNVPTSGGASECKVASAKADLKGAQKKVTFKCADGRQIVVVKDSQQVRMRGDVLK
jgi:hypothetical protein